MTRVNGRSSLPRESLPDSYRALEVITGLENLETQVDRQVGMLFEVAVDDVQRVLRVLPAEERAEPAADEEDAAMSLNPGKAVQSCREKRQRERLMLGCIEGAQAGGGPFLIECGVREVALEVV